MELKQLKSGSDIRGTAYGEDAVLTADIVSRFAAAFAQWRSDEGAPLRFFFKARSRKDGAALGAEIAKLKKD